MANFNWRNTTLAFSTLTPRVGATFVATVSLCNYCNQKVNVAGANAALRDTTGRVTFAAATNDGNGVYTIVGTAVSVGIAAIVVSVNGQNKSFAAPALTVQAASAVLTPANCTLSGAPTSIAVGDNCTLTVTAKDQFGNPMASGGATVTISATSGSGVSAGTLSSVTDNGNGTYTATFTGTSTGTATSISATINSVALPTGQTVAITVTSNSVLAPANCTLSGSPTTLNVGGVCTLTLVAFDQFGVQLPAGGVAVVLSATSGIGVAQVTLSGVTDNGDGSYSATATGLATGAPVTLSAAVNGAALPGGQAVAITVAQPGYSLSAPAQDANRNTIKPALQSGRNIYCSQTRGNDSNDGETILTPKKTIAAAKALIRNGYGDHLLLRCGDVWTETGTNAVAPMSVTFSGPSRSDPIIIASYGNGPRPLIKTGRFNGVQRTGASGLSHLQFYDLDFYCDTRDPDSATYDATVTDPCGFYWVTDGTDIHIENCRFRFYVMNLSIDPPSRINDLRIRRNQILNGYQVTGSNHGDLGHNAFIAKATDLLFDQNTVDHGGWNDTVSGAGYFDQRHNTYTRSIINGSYVGNIFSRGSNLGLSITTTVIGGEVASSNNLIAGNLFVLNGNDIAFGADAAGINNNATVTGNVFTETGHTISGAPQSNGIGINYATGLQITGNYFLNKGDLGYGAYLSIAAHAQVGITFTGNTAYNWVGTGLPTSDLSTSKANCTLTPNDLGLSAGTYVDPSRSVASYNAAWAPGSAGTIADFCTKAAANRAGAWDPTWTASAVIDYLTAGFVKVATSTSLLTLAPSNSLALRFAPSGLQQVKVNGSQVMWGSLTLGDPTNYIRAGDNPGGIAPGAATSQSLYPLPSGEGALVVHVQPNARTVYEYRIGAGAEDLAILAYVTNTSSGGGSGNINVGLFYLPTLYATQAMVTDANQWSSGSGGDWQTNGGVDGFGPSLPTQFQGWFARDGNGSWGVGYTGHIARSSKCIVALDKNTAALQRTPVWAQAWTHPTGAPGITPGNTRAAALNMRVSTNADKWHLMDGYRLGVLNIMGMTYNPDQRTNVYSMAADVGGSGTYSYLRRLDTIPGVTQEIAYANSVAGITGKGSGFIIFNWAGMDPAYPHLVDPNFIELLQSGSGSPQSAQMASLVAGVVAAGLIPMIGSRPGDKRNSDANKTPVKNDYR